MVQFAIGRGRPGFALFALLAAGPGPGAAQCDGISPATSASLSTVRVAAGLSRPLFAVSPPKDLERLFVVEQDGKVRLVRNGVLNATPFLDVSALTRSPSDGGPTNEEGLLGLAFHPGYVDNGTFFVYHTDATGENNLLVRYERNGANPDEADPASRQVILTQPHPNFSNHNGGMIAFGPLDGYLYVATGDGGDSCDPSGNAQSLSSRLGKLLRIDVDSAFPYAIPPGNPFTGPGQAPEIWAYGLRNPYRFSFDSANGDLYIGDVGQNVWEEVDYRPAPALGGANFGWDIHEGDHCPIPSCLPPGVCDPPGYVGPILEYEQGPGCAVTGGFVYRGCRMPDLHGTYFYSDFCAAFLKTFRVVNGARTEDRDRTAEMAPGGGAFINAVTSFGQDASGELYITDRGGELFKIVPAFASLEDSGIGAVPFLPGLPDWSWEDLRGTTGYAVAAYRVYRTDGFALPYTCVLRTENNTWVGGDPAIPEAGALWAYVVVGELADGRQTSPGAGSGGAPRALSAADCPP